MRHSNDCIDACLACVIMCEKCISHCLKIENLQCMQVCRDCADICSICARMEARDSPFTQEMHDLCGKISGRCAEQCRQQDSHYSTYGECAEACQTCAEICSIRSNISVFKDKMSTF